MINWKSFWHQIAVAFSTMRAVDAADERERCAWYDAKRNHEIRMRFLLNEVGDGMHADDCLK